MTYVIAEPCVGVKDGSCAAACPVDAIHTTPAADLYFIDPEECICGLCIPECPVDAIFPGDELPGRWDRFRGMGGGPSGRDWLSGSPVPKRPPWPPSSMAAEADLPRNDG